MAGSPISGKFGRFQINNAVLTFDKWKVTPRGQDIPTTNFEDIDAFGNTFSSGITGVLEADIEGNGFYDTVAVGTGVIRGKYYSNIGAFGSAMAGSALVPGVLVPAAPVKLFYDKRSNTAAFTFPQIRILQCPMDVDVNGRVNFSLQAKNNGPYTFPS